MLKTYNTLNFGNYKRSLRKLDFFKNECYPHLIHMESQPRELLTKPEKPLLGRSALITGATRWNGIGFAISERLALDGANIILVGTERSRERAPELEEHLKRYGVKVHTLFGDVTNEQSATSMIEEAYQLCNGNVDILVNNAGINTNKTFTEMTNKDYESVMDAKARGAFNMTRAWYEIRNNNNILGGRVINIGSVVGIYGNYGQAPYGMANAALEGLTQCLELEFGRRDINVNLVAPTFVEGTDIASSIGDQLDAIKAVTPTGKVASPRDIANVVAFLAGPDSDMITGITLPVDGGIKSNFTALTGLYKAGYRQIPRQLFGVLPGMTAGEAKQAADYVKQLRQNSQ